MGTVPLRPQRKETYNMVGFVIGMIVGSIFGIALMCLLQINRNEREDE